MQKTVNRLGSTGRRAWVLGAAVLTFGAVAPQVQAQVGTRQPPAQARMRQQRMNPAQRLERHIQMLTRRLQLTPQQATQIRTILREEQTRRLAARPQGGWRNGQRPDSTQMRQLRERMRAEREQTRRRIEAVLNEQQRATFRQMEARQTERRVDRRRERRDERRERRGGSGRPGVGN